MCFVVLFVFQSKIYPVFSGACVIFATFQCHSVGFCIVLCVVLALNSLAVQSRACISVAKYEHSPFFWKPCQNCFQIIFTENEIRQKRTDGESAKAVREQVFLSRYKSEPGIVEPSVSKSSAYWYCCLDFWVAHGSKINVDEKYSPWSVAKNGKKSNFCENRSFFVFLKCAVICIQV